MEQFQTGRRFMFKLWPFSQTACEWCDWHSNLLIISWSQVRFISQEITVWIKWQQHIFHNPLKLHNSNNGRSIAVSIWKSFFDSANAISTDNDNIRHEYGAFWNWISTAWFADVIRVSLHVHSMYHPPSGKSKSSGQYVKPVPHSIAQKCRYSYRSIAETRTHWQHSFSCVKRGISYSSVWT